MEEARLTARLQTSRSAIVAEEAMALAADICVYTNTNLTIESL